MTTDRPSRECEKHRRLHSAVYHAFAPRRVQTDSEPVTCDLHRWQPPLVRVPCIASVLASRKRPALKEQRRGEARSLAWRSRTSRTSRSRPTESGASSARRWLADRKRPTLVRSAQAWRLASIQFSERALRPQPAVASQRQTAPSALT